MKLEMTVEGQMGSPLFFLRKPLSWIVVLASVLLISAYLLGFGFFSILLITSTVLTLSTLLYTFPTQNPGFLIDQKSLSTEEVHENNSPQTEDFVSKQKPESEALITQQKEEQETGKSLHKIDQDYLARSQDSLSESECLDESSTTEDCEIDWEFQEHVSQSPDYSDGSISDEDSLIEIALPSGHYVGHNYKELEEPKFTLQEKFPAEFTPRSIFQQHNLMELLAEFNEEDNLIEIDISMGSIKCSRFEIEA